MPLDMIIQIEKIRAYLYLENDDSRTVREGV
jgi:hypothetical protein